MKLLLSRLYKKNTYTIGRLFVNGKYFCDTLEDRFRDLTREKKIPGETAIPAGTYEVTVNMSPKFGRELPRLLNVPFFDGILIHRGSNDKHTSGCILVVENTKPGRLVNSPYHEIKLTALIKDAISKGEKVYITIE